MILFTTLVLTLISSHVNAADDSFKVDLNLLPTPGPDGFYDQDSGQTFYWHFGQSGLALPNVCDKNGSVLCVVKDGLAVVANAGLVSNVTEAKESSDHVSLTFENGQDCNESHKYKTRFDIFCPSAAEDVLTKFMLAKTGDGCTINFFMWHNLPNCQNTSSKVVGCSLEIPMFEQKLDLSVLKAKTYDAYSDDKSQHFQLNICGGVQGGDHCATGTGLCDVTSTTPIIGTEWTTKSWFKEDTKEVVMDYATANKKATFTFVCNDDGSTSDDPVIQFTGRESLNDLTIYRFLVRTRVVCLSKPQEDCSVVDADSKAIYDLANIRASLEDWVAYDNRPGMTLRQYHLSVCKPLSPASVSVECPGLKTGVCMTNKKSAESANLGSIPAAKLELKKDDNNALLLTYGIGANCNAKNNYSAQIIFRCDETEKGPTLFDSFEDCSYIFEWRTPEACPKSVAHTAGCSVRDDYFGHTFNISSLHKSGKDITTSDGGFAINICGGLKDSSCGQDATICQHGKTLASSSSESLTYDDGQLSLSYEGSSCPENPAQKIKTNLLLHCDHKVGDGMPELGFHNDCSYNFIWKTTRACPPFNEVECKVADENGEIFDLSPLALPDSNYEVTTGHGSSFAINVCKSLVHTPTYHCPYNSAVCQRSAGEGGKNVFTNVGELVDGPKLDEHSRLILEYSNGGLCKETGTDETHITSKIIFNCRMDRKDSKPNFIEKIGCTYIFWWDNHIACPQNTTHLITQDSCMVTDETTGHTFDLRPLSNVTNDLLQDVDQDGNTYYVGICNLLQNSTIAEKCGQHASACMKDKDGHYKSIGKFNDRLTLDFSEPVLFYDDGAQHTSIHFKCAPFHSFHTGKLKLLEQVKNHFFFDYYTTLACQFTVKCEVSQSDGGGRIDLSPLKSFSEDAKIVSDGTETLFSVCKPLIGRASVRCPHGSAICATTSRHKNNNKEVLGYGVASQPPYVDRNGDVIIHYEGGSVCDKENNLRFNSTIRFKCNPSLFPGRPIGGVPEFDHGGCHANYVWETQAACPNAFPTTDYDTDSVCQITHPFYPYYSLSSLRSKEDLAIKSRSNVANTYYIQPCGRSNHCNGTMCFMDSAKKKVYSLGNLADSRFLFEEKEMRVRYANGDKCSSGDLEYSAEIRFVCADNKSINSLELIDELPCHPIFKWTDPKICKPLVVPFRPSPSSLSSSSSSSYWGIVLIVVVCVVGGVYLRKPQNRERAHETLVWMRVSMCQRRRREDRNLLVESNVNIPTFGSLEVEDDDDLIIA